MSNDKLSNEKLRDALNKGLNRDPKVQDKTQDDVVLTDSDLDDVAGGMMPACGAMCGTF
jgi:hypothetical protein